MPHFPKPFFRESRGLWYIQIDGKQHRLGPNGPDDVCDEEEAHLRAAALKQRLRVEVQKQPSALVKQGTPVVTVFDAFLDWCQKHKKQRTYASYRERIQSFVRFAKPGEYTVKDLTVEELRPFHVQEWVDSHPNWSDGTKRGCIVAVQRAFNQQAKLGRIDRSPIAHMEKPAQGKRDQLIALEDFEDILRRVPNEPFRDVLRFSWMTGARPQETIIVEARHVDLKHARVIIPPEEAKGGRFRVIYLTGPAVELVQRLIDRHPEGKLFRNSRGRPWHPYAINCAFNRLQLDYGRERMLELGIKPSEEEVAALAATLKPEVTVKGKRRKKTKSELLVEARKKLKGKLARQHGTKYCLYNLRHSWAQRALLNGVDPVTVSVLMGHADTSMLAKVYQHLAQNPDYLRDAATRAIG